MTPEGIDKRGRILIVEDVATTRNMYVRALKLEGDYRIDGAADLTEAIDALDRCTYQVALVDIMLAGEKDTANRDGLKVLERIRDLGEGTMAVVLSAQESKQLIRGFLKEYDAYDYLDKGEVKRQGIDTMIEFVANATKASPVGEEPSWDAAVAPLAGHQDEPMFVSEAMKSLSFRGGFENLRRTVIASLVHLLPLVPERTDETGLAFDEDREAMVGSYWSKGQGCAIELALLGKVSERLGESASGEGEVLVEREKAGLRVIASRVPGAPREDFAESSG